MKKLFNEVTNSFDNFEKASKKDAFLQNRNVIVKLPLLLVFIATILSFNKYSMLNMLPYLFLLIFLTALSDLSFKSILLKILLVSPFVLFIGVFNPFLDISSVEILGISVRGGIISFISILLKFVLTVWASLLLVYTTSFLQIMVGLKFYRLPDVIVNQFYFTYRYIETLMEEAITIQRARRARLANFDVKIFATVVGQMFLKILNRTQNIHNSMIMRGFDGKLVDKNMIKVVDVKEVTFLLFSLLFIIFLRLI